MPETLKRALAVAPSNPAAWLRLAPSTTRWGIESHREDGRAISLDASAGRHAGGRLLLATSQTDRAGASLQRRAYRSQPSGTAGESEGRMLARKASWPNRLNFEKPRASAPATPRRVMD